MHEVYYLENEYILDVKVRDGDSYYAGKLTLTPKECFLELATERTPSESFKYSESLVCISTKYSSATFLLYGLKLVHMSIGMLEVIENKQIWSFSIKFQIQYTVISHVLHLENKKIRSFNLKSNFIKKWTLHTKTQDQILNSLYNRDDNPIFCGMEFEEEIQNYGNIGIFYSSTQFSSINELNTGLKIFPEIRVTFLNQLEMNDIFHEYLKLYQLLTLFNGSDFKIDSIEIGLDDFRPSSIAYLYFPSSQNVQKNDYTLLPLGKDVIYNDQQLASLPLNFFDSYYNLPDEKKELFKRYLNYKRLNSIEEKFLGYFRLIEKLTFKTKSYVDNDSLSNLLERSKSYLSKKLECNSKTMANLNKRILRANNSKYNTEKCIADFYDTLPQEIQSSLIFKKEDLIKICKLRNDITHANDYVISDHELYEYTIFINALLFLAITNLLLEIPLEACIPIARRLQQI